MAEEVAAVLMLMLIFAMGRAEPNCIALGESAPSEARLCAFLMKQEQNELSESRELSGMVLV